MKKSKFKAINFFDLKIEYSNKSDDIDTVWYENLLILIFFQVKKRNSQR